MLLFCPQLTAAIVFLSFGIVTSFLCLMVDGACIALNIVSYLHVVMQNDSNEAHVARAVCHFTQITPQV